MTAENPGEKAGVRVVLITVPDEPSGINLARRLVQEGLAACGNVIPGLTSVYRWKGEIQEDPEALLILKTTKEALRRLERRVAELHPYDLPEFLALNVTDGSRSYLRWVTEEVEGSEVSQ